MKSATFLPPQAPARTASSTGDERLITPSDVISVALSSFVPGPAYLISPTGYGVTLILKLLKKTGFKIVPMERGDYERKGGS